MAGKGLTQDITSCKILDKLGIMYKEENEF